MNCFLTERSNTWLYVNHITKLQHMKDFNILINIIDHAATHRDTLKSVSMAKIPLEASECSLDKQLLRSHLED